MSKLEREEEEAFAQAVADGMSQKEAYRTIFVHDASDKTAREGGWRWANKGRVKQRIRQIKGVTVEQLAARRMDDRDEIMASLEDVLERTMQAKPVRDKKGNATGEWRFDASNAIKAIELKGREMGMFEKTSNRRELPADPFHGKTQSQIKAMAMEAAQLAMAHAVIVDVNTAPVTEIVEEPELIPEQLDS